MDRLTQPLPISIDGARKEAKSRQNEMSALNFRFVEA